MHVSLFGRNENVIIVECDQNVCISTIINLLKCMNVGSIHIELGKDAMNIV